MISSSPRKIKTSLPENTLTAVYLKGGHSKLTAPILTSLPDLTPTDLPVLLNHIFQRQRSSVIQKNAAGLEGFSRAWKCLSRSICPGGYCWAVPHAHGVGGLEDKDSITPGVSDSLIFILSLWSDRLFHKVTVLDKDNDNNKINYFSHSCGKGNWRIEGVM